MSVRTMSERARLPVGEDDEHRRGSKPPTTGAAREENGSRRRAELAAEGDASV